MRSAHKQRAPQRPLKRFDSLADRRCGTVFAARGRSNGAGFNDGDQTSQESNIHKFPFAQTKANPFYPDTRPV